MAISVFFGCISNYSWWFHHKEIKIKHLREGPEGKAGAKGDKDI